MNFFLVCLKWQTGLDKSVCVLTLACLWDSSSSKDATLSSATSNGVWPLKTKQNSSFSYYNFPSMQANTHPPTHCETELWLTAVLLLAAELWCILTQNRSSTLPLSLRVHDSCCALFSPTYQASTFAFIFQFTTTVHLFYLELQYIGYCYHISWCQYRCKMFFSESTDYNTEK